MSYTAIKPILVVSKRLYEIADNMYPIAYLSDLKYNIKKYNSFYEKFLYIHSRKILNDHFTCETTKKDNIIIRKADYKIYKKDYITNLCTDDFNKTICDLYFNDSIRHKKI